MVSLQTLFCDVQALLDSAMHDLFVKIRCKTLIIVCFSCYPLNEAQRIC